MEDLESVTKEQMDLPNTQEQSPLPPKITKDNIDPDANSKKGIILMWVQAVLYTMLSSLLIAFAAKTMITPNGFTIGGASGIAILVEVVSQGKIPQSIVGLCLNAPLVVLSFFFVKKKFAILTSLNIFLQAFWLFILESFFTDFKIIFPGKEPSRIFAAVAAGLAIGVAIALAFKVGGSTGGADILAVLIQKKVKANSIAWMLFIINCVVIVSYVIITNLTVYELPKTESGAIDYGMLLLPIVLSAFESYMESKTMETVSNGFQSAIEFRIITEKPDEMATEIMRELSRGVTAIPATGMYSKITRTMLLCVVNKRQVASLKRIMNEVDPDSFAVVSDVSQVLGLGFYADDAN